MPRINPITDDTKEEAHELLFKRSLEIWGSVPNFYRTIAHAPDALEHVIGLMHSIRKNWRNDPQKTRLMQLATVKPSMMNQCLV